MLKDETYKEKITSSSRLNVNDFINNTPSAYIHDINNKNLRLSLASEDNI